MKHLFQPCLLFICLSFFITACSKSSGGGSLAGSWGVQRQTDVLIDSSQSSLTPSVTDTTFSSVSTILNMNSAKRYQITNYVNGKGKTADSGAYTYANGIIKFISSIDSTITSSSYTLSGNTFKTTTYHYEPGYSDEIIITYGRLQ